MKEQLTKAAQTADLLAQDLKEGHTAAIASGDQFAELAILEIQPCSGAANLIG